MSADKPPVSVEHYRVWVDGGYRPHYVLLLHRPPIRVMDWKHRVKQETA